MKLLVRVAGLALGVFMVLYLAKHPVESAHAARGLGHWLGGVADGLGSFLTGLAK